MDGISTIPSRPAEEDFLKRQLPRDTSKRGSIKVKSMLCGCGCYPWMQVHIGDPKFVCSLPVCTSLLRVCIRATSGRAAGLNPMSWDISDLVNRGVIYASIFTRVCSAVSLCNAKCLCRCDWSFPFQLDGSFAVVRRTNHERLKERWSYMSS